MSKHKNIVLFKKIANLDALEFEKTERLDHINKADAGGDNVVWVSLTLLDGILFYGTYFVAMGIFFFTLRPCLLQVKSFQYCKVNVSTL
jgi:ATP-binding cassette subfamily B protein